MIIKKDGKDDDNDNIIKPSSNSIRLQTVASCNFVLYELRSSFK